jgi:hypothetical protein
VLSTFKGKNIEGRTGLLVLMLEQSYMREQAKGKVVEQEEKDERIIIPRKH